MESLLFINHITKSMFYIKLFCNKILNYVPKNFCVKHFHIVESIKFYNTFTNHCDKEHWY